MVYTNYRKGYGNNSGILNNNYSIGMRYYKERNYAKAIEYLEKDIKENEYYRTIFTLGKCYQKTRQPKKAENAFKRVLELAPKDVYARLELGKLYVKQGKAQQAEKLFLEYMQLDPKNVHARMELGKLYAEQGKDEKSKEMYDYIIANMGEDNFDEENRVKHFMKHMKDDKTKEIHGVFQKEPLEILNAIDLDKCEKQIGYMNDIYCVKIEGCGYAGGSKGDGHTLDYITIITLPNTKQLITMFPSDEIRLKEKNKDCRNEER